jgi:hypothetical protein
MNPWPFIIISYGLTLLGTIGLAWASLVAMRRAESDAAALRDKP